MYSVMRPPQPRSREYIRGVLKQGSIIVCNTVGLRADGPIVLGLLRQQVWSYMYVPYACWQVCQHACQLTFASHTIIAHSPGVWILCIIVEP